MRSARIGSACCSCGASEAAVYDHEEDVLDREREREKEQHDAIVRAMRYELNEKGARCLRLGAGLPAAFSQDILAEIPVLVTLGYLRKSERFLTWSTTDRGREALEAYEVKKGGVK